MSSKKIVISKDFSIRLNEVAKYLLFDKRRQGKFAKMIGVSPSYFSEVINSKTGPSFKLLFGIAKEFPGINLNWLLTGDEEMIRGLEIEPEIQVSKETPLYNKVGNLDDEPETAGLLSMTREILKSGTEYSASLAANIRSFHCAIKTEKKLNGMDNDVSEIKDIVKELVGELENIKQNLKQTDKIREGNHESEKGEVLKKRVM